MDGQDYYRNLMEQGFSETDAAHYTAQYYPNFQAPMQGLGMPAPPPPGSMELAGAGAQGLGFAGAAAGGAAAAGGGMSMKTIVIVSVLVLGGGGTAGYFIYDYLTEPDFYGEVYWSEWGIGYSFEEDAMFIVTHSQQKVVMILICLMMKMDLEMWKKRMASASLKPRMMN